MEYPKFAVLHESADVLVVAKPAGLVCHPSKDGASSSLVGQVRLHLGDATEAHLINRLDRETSGLVLVAKQREWARFLRQLWEQRLVEKTYLAIVHGHPLESTFRIDAPLGPDDESPVAVKDCVRSDGAPSETGFEVIENFTWRDAPFGLLRVKPKTGRKHQIRIHASFAGYPLVGDKLYGRVPGAYLDMCEGKLSDEQRASLILESHALHAFRLEIPLGDHAVCMVGPLSDAMRRFCREGGVTAAELDEDGRVDSDLDLRLLEALCCEAEDESTKAILRTRKRHPAPKIS